MQINKRIKKIRKNFDMDQKELAEIAGISLRSLQRIEGKNSEFTLNNLNKVLFPFGLKARAPRKRILLEAR